MISEAQRKLARQGNEIVRLTHGRRVVLADLFNSRLIVLIHGFTADATYMLPLAEQFEQNGWVCLAFNYACFDGIDVAAASLVGILDGLNRLSADRLSKEKIALVSHSMGGLVSRAALSINGGARYIDTVVTLGTPHAGTLSNQKLAEYLLIWGEAISGIAYGGYSPKCRSALQLLGSDKSEQFIDRLNSTPIDPGLVKFFSISGGLPYLEFGRSAFVNRIANAWVQREFGGRLNDGLVLEASSDLSGDVFHESAPNCRHISDYPEHPKVNHTHLVQSHRVALEVMHLLGVVS